MGRVLHVLQPVNDSNARELACFRVLDMRTHVYKCTVARMLYRLLTSAKR
jgi:hypothetical protein